MSVREFLGLGKNPRALDSKKEDDSEITKPLRELTDGEILLGKINLMYLNPSTISDKQLGEVGTSIPLPSEKLKDILSDLGIENTKKEGKATVTVFHNQEEEGVLLRNSEFNLLFESEDCGKLWRFTDINSERYTYISGGVLRSLTQLIEVYGEVLELINRGGSF